MDPSHYKMDMALPLGQYYFQGHINDLYGTTGESNVFEVVRGQNSSCLNGTTLHSPSPSTSPSSASGSNHLSGGAITGIVVGVVLVIVVVAGFLFYRRRIRSRQQTVDGAWIGDRYIPGIGSDMLYNHRVASPIPVDHSGRRHLGAGTTHTLADPPTEMSETDRSSDNPFASKDDDNE